MVRKPNPFFCRKCGATGGTLTLRPVSTGKVKHWYLVHYDTSSKSGKRSCHLGAEGSTALSDVLPIPQVRGDCLQLCLGYVEYDQKIWKLWKRDKVYSLRGWPRAQALFAKSIGLNSKRLPEREDVLFGKYQMAYYEISEMLERNGWPAELIEHKISADLERLQEELTAVLKSGEKVSFTDWIDREIKHEAILRRAGMYFAAPQQPS